MVALRMQKRGLLAASGDTIPYVICTAPMNADGATGSLSDCAYHPDELRRDPTLKLDYVWYLQTQLHPPIARLCEHIEGTDTSQLAACLGLDPRKFRPVTRSETIGAPLIGASSRFSTLLSDEERFADVEKVKLTCGTCAKEAEFVGLVKGKKRQPG